MLGYSHKILNTWKNYFSQLLNVHRVNDVKEIEVHTSGPLIPEPRPFEFNIAIENMKFINRQVLACSGRIDTSRDVKYCVMRSISLIILFGIRKNWLSSGISLLLYQFTIGR
jgi:hypothetical protein